MFRSLPMLFACFTSFAALAQQSAVDEALEAPMQALDNVADLNEAINEDRRRRLAPASVTNVTPFANDEPDEDTDKEDEGAAPEVEEKNVFSGLKDDFEHDDVDIYNAPDLDHEDDFEEDEEVDQERLLD